MGSWRSARVAKVAVFRGFYGYQSTLALHYNGYPRDRHGVGLCCGDTTHSESFGVKSDQKILRHGSREHLEGIETIAPSRLRN
jgi:hypothetical protein